MAVCVAEFGLSYPSTKWEAGRFKEFVPACPAMGYHGAWLWGWGNALVALQNDNIETLDIGADVDTLSSKEVIISRLQSELLEAKLNIDRLLTRDPLTGLFNRRGLQRALMSQAADRLVSGLPMSAVYIDCESLGEISKAFGHSVGDLVVVEVAKRVGKAIRDTDLACRIGTSGFLIVLPDTKLASAEVIAERLRLAVEGKPVLYSPQPLRLTATASCAELSPHLSSLEEALGCVRVARTGGATQSPATEEVSPARASAPARVEGLLRGLPSGTGLRMKWQPIVRLSDEEKFGCEMLVRGPEGPFESPQDLFRLAREYDLLTLLDLQCLKLALDSAREFKAKGQVHLNVLPSTLMELPIRTLESLFEPKLDAATYVLELSEQQYFGDPDLLVKRLDVVRAMGVSLAIDDLGGGNGTLDSLVLFAPDLVKIDIGLVRGVSKDARKEAILRRFVKAALALGAEVVAEGVEDRDDLAIVRDTGVLFAQGYLWAKPHDPGTR